MSNISPVHQSTIRLLKIYCVTWNVAGTITDRDMSELLWIDKASPSDVYAIGLQEIDALIGSANSHAWTQKFVETFQGKGYIRVKSIVLQGMLLIVFVKRIHLSHTLHIEAKVTRTGFAGLWGDKGGVSIRLDIGGINLCFVNCHLAAHQDEVVSRIEDFSSIIQDQSFKDEDVDNILDHDYVFWLGDMNFRIDNMDRETILDHISQKKYEIMRANDQLLQVKHDELAFIDFHEGKIDFPPTYKFDIDTDFYDTSYKKRLPAWTDRILWMVHEDAFSGATLQVKQHVYTSVPSYKNSDHRPVKSIFDITVFFNPPKQSDITFEPISSWQKSKAPSFTYTIKEGVITTTSDWIGLYKDDVEDFDNYVAYVYATANTGSITQTFSESSLYGKNGQYILCYFDGAETLLGSSNTFTIKFPQKPDTCCHVS